MGLYRGSNLGSSRQASGSRVLGAGGRFYLNPKSR